MDSIYTCPSCGKCYTRRHTPESYIGNNCFECSFWLGKTDYPDYIKEHQVIINGEHFMLGETEGPFRGFGGRRFKFSSLMAVSSRPPTFGGRVLSRSSSGICCRTMLCSCLWMKNQRLEVPMFDFDWFDDPVYPWMIIGPLSEELPDEERERRQLEDDIDQDDDE